MIDLSVCTWMQLPSSTKALFINSYFEKELLVLPSNVDVATRSSVVLPCQAPKGNPSFSVNWKIKA